jgi:hypothetical protein
MPVEGNSKVFYLRGPWNWMATDTNIGTWKFSRSLATGEVQSWKIIKRWKIYVYDQNYAPNYHTSYIIRLFSFGRTITMCSLFLHFAKEISLTKLLLKLKAYVKASHIKSISRLQNIIVYWKMYGFQMFWQVGEYLLWKYFLQVVKYDDKQQELCLKCSCHSIALLILCKSFFTPNFILYSP